MELKFIAPPPNNPNPQCRRRLIHSYPYLRHTAPKCAVAIQIKIAEEQRNCTYTGTSCDKYHVEELDYTDILNLRDDGTGHANAVKNTLIFNGFVLCQIFNELNARNPEEMNVFSGMTKNYLFMGIVGSVFVLQIINVQFLGKFTSTVKLDWNLWLVSLAMGIFSWPLAVVGKLIPVPKTPLAKVFIKPYQHCIATRNG